MTAAHAIQFWQQRTNVWRGVTSPAGGAKRQTIRFTEPQNALVTGLSCSAATSGPAVLSQEEFLSLIKAAGSAFYPPDDEQAKAVYADPRADLFIVAGPGTGKTSCLSFRALYLIFVAGFAPRSVMATTFTKKAAAELRSRLLGWGYRVIDAATKTDLPQSTLESLKAIDLNQILTGTIDSLAENILREHRAAGEEPPVLADEYITRTIMARDGLLDTKLYFSTAWRVARIDFWLQFFKQSRSAANDSRPSP
jgi:superfamily I DNA/RNA helicase